MNIFKLSFWSSLADAFVYHIKKWEFHYIPITIFSLFLSLPFFVVYSIFDSLGGSSDV